LCVADPRIQPLHGWQTAEEAMPRPRTLAAALLAVSLWYAPSNAAETTISGPVLSVYDDGFRVADDKAQPVRVDAWSLCGDETRKHISRGDRITVQGDREWRHLYATSLTKDDGTPVCPENAAPRY
jgi:hypothetical protein